MKKTLIISLISYILSISVMYPLSRAATNSSTGLSSTFFSVIHSLYASVSATVESSAPASVQPSTPSAPVASGFPLPKGVTVEPPLLSAAVTSIITVAIKSTITPALMKMITEKDNIETSASPAVSLPVATFKPVGPPSGISTPSTAIQTSTSPMGGAPGSKSEFLAMEIKSLKPQSFTGSFDITSRYVFRGISQSANNMAFQGGLSYTFLTTGIYLSVWGSNVDFLSRQGQQASVKADTIAGLKNTIGKYFTYDLSMVRYNYPKAAGANYNEFVTLLTYRILTITLGYSPNAFNAHANGLYYNGGFNIPIPEEYAFQYPNVSLIGNYGHYNLSKDAGLRSYSDFMLGLKKSINQYTLMLQWIGTNGEAKLKGLDANRLVVTLAVNF